MPEYAKGVRKYSKVEDFQMESQQIINEYIEFLWNMFKYDMDVFSKGWLYYWLLIPAMFYFVFYILKWIVLTCPIWMPISIIVKTLANFKSDKKSDK